MDTDLRELERAAASGDADAVDRLICAKERAGLPLTLPELSKKLKAFQKEVRESGTRSLELGFKQFFQKYGDKVGSFHWQQYTPYWADGERTEFSYYSFMNAGQVEWLDETLENLPWQDTKKEPTHLALQEIDDFLSKHEDLLLMIYGDDAEITVTPDGITRDDYTDHD